MDFEKVIKFWFKISDKIRFLIIGSFNTACTYVLYSLLCFFCGENIYQIALSISWIITTFSGFFLKRSSAITIEIKVSDSLIIPASVNTTML